MWKEIQPEHRNSLIPRYKRKKEVERKKWKVENIYCIFSWSPIIKSYLLTGFQIPIWAIGNEPASEKTQYLLILSKLQGNPSINYFWMTRRILLKECHEEIACHIKNPTKLYLCLNHQPFSSFMMSAFAFAYTRACMRVCVWWFVYNLHDHGTTCIWY